MAVYNLCQIIPTSDSSGLVSVFFLIQVVNFLGLGMTVMFKIVVSAARVFRQES